ncbi:MAG: putative quinol monooxygenase [Vicinamibacterales bacterium]
MAATVHVIARWLAKPGKEEALKAVLTALIPPSRREIGCYQYDLLRNPADPRDFCFVERWDHDKALEQHSATPHVATAMSQAQDLAEAPPDVRRYHIL